MAGDGEMWLLLEPETVQERLAAGGVIDALRRLRLAGLSKHCMIQVTCRGREVEVKIHDTSVGHATQTQQIVVE